MHISTVQSIGQRQSVVMTAQLQKAICLLQYSNVDLHSVIESESEDNPFIEVKSGAAGDSQSMRGVGSTSRGGGMDQGDMLARIQEHDQSLYSHVSVQFDMLFPDPAERLTADVFLEALEPSGWLGEPLEMLAQRIGVSMEEAEDWLVRVQQVEPSGLFARSLAECLALQAEDQGVMTPLFRTLLENLPKLAQADLKGLMRACNCDMDELRPALKLLRSLNPKPGADFNGAVAPQRAPDLIVTRAEEGWKVDLNKSTLPSVMVNEKKAAALKAAHGEYVNDTLSVALWLRRAVAHRNQTTLAVGAEILRRQSKFMEKGPAGLVPMTLKDVAEAVGVHESTVSRVTTDLLMQTPQGTFPLKYLFSASLRKDEGEGGESAAAVRHRIQQLVREEDATSPLSDDAIAKIITAEGTHLARRTVAKYRDILKIPSSFQRRRNALLQAD
ncbi:RNA polymerase factor sigma-54 [Thalassovita aquimarina]|uniref:RNA polymerase sigma-54 factor n=1 Tax=Thalassovita aquimarina TaxID=2785917 RepID=A0ABS5HL12_9RHOB|nr:RNA polymerase factor sigma-54 [Thalassovita aquimarina]MBR9649665.1 RNA polymerase factor sigma-54 [Thalassovita aquimarina]